MTTNGRTCTACGATLSAKAPDGLCPRCLFGLALGDDSSPRDELIEPVSAPATEARGRRFGDFDLLEPIARGGMGVVWRARQRRLQRTVALKIVSGGWLADPGMVERFRVEATAAARLDHPNVVPIYEVGEHDGEHFFAMKLIEGGLLSSQRAVRGDKPSLANAVGLVITIARAVHYAHQRGILHRDLKPGNILLDSQKVPHLTDFGIAKVVEGTATITRTAAILGTPSYMSPEQASGQVGQTTTAVDVYGLGAVLYDLMTGQPPFAGGTTMETIRQVIEESPRRPSAANPAVDRDLETICLKCLEKDPSHRYASADALAEDLERWQKGEPILARPGSSLEKILKWVRRRPAVAALSLIAALALMSVFLVSSLFTLRLRTARRDVAEQATSNRVTAVRLLVSEATRAVNDGDYYGALLPFSKALQLESGSREGEIVQRRRLGAMLRTSPRLEQLWLHDGAVMHAALSPDERSVAVAASDGTAQVWDLEHGARVGPPLVHTCSVVQVVMSPDNRRLATVSRYGHVQVWNFQSGQRLGPLLDHRMEFMEPVLFGPDGKLLVVPGRKVAEAWRVDPELVRAFTFTGAGLVHGVGLNQDGTTLVTGGADHLARFWDLRNGQEILRPLQHPQLVQFAAFAGKDRLVVTMARDWSLRVWNPRSGELLCRTEPNDSDILSWSISRSGRWVATAGFDNMARVWDTTNAGPPLALLRHQSAVDTVNFSDDDSWLVTGSFDGTARMWERRSGRPRPPYFRHTAGVTVALPAGHNRTLFTAGFGGDARLWQLVQNNGAREVLELSKPAVLATFGTGPTDVIVVCEDGSVQLWSPRNGPASTWLVQHGKEVDAAATTPDRRRLAVGGADGEVSLWQPGQASAVLRIQSPEGWSPWSRWNPGRIRWLAISPDASRLAVATVNGSVFLWNVQSSSARLVARLEPGHAIFSMDFSPDSRWLATADDAGKAHVWDAATGKLTRELTLYDAAAGRIEFSPDGRKLVTANWDYSNNGLPAQLWDPDTGKQITPPMFHRDGLLTARFSFDGRYVATGGEDNLARVWHSDSGLAATPFLVHAGFVVALAFSHSGRLVATASRDGTARVWDIQDGQPVTGPLRHGTEVTQVEFSSDDQWLLTVSSDQTVRLWDVSPTDWQATDLMRLAELLSSHRLEANGEQTPLTRAEMKERWEFLRAKHPEYWLSPY